MKPGKYTVLEILLNIADSFVIGEGDEAIELEAEKVIGKYRVRIGGITGLVDPEKLINLNFEDGTEQVIVGDKEYQLNVK